ncbi:hypothetical protein QTP86_028613, partial [Hemibagrus guttatus]
MYREEGTKCAFLLSLMTDRALEWASAVWDTDPQVKLSFAYFAGMIREVFEYPAGGKDISLQLMELRQGSETAADYAIRFRTLAAQSGWNDVALWAVFRAGLNPGLQAELACHTEATSLSQFVATTIRLDNLQRQHRTGTQASASARPRVRTDYPEHREEATEPMQLGRSRKILISPGGWQFPVFAGHIRPSTSPVAAGFFFVGKRDGGLQPCIDYRGLNAITVRYPYPLPLVPAALEQLRGARVFTKLDLRSAYNLVRIREGDEWKTAFHTTSGHYEYCVMPFGLTNAPAVFQALINGVFQDLLGKGVIAYIDDILVYSSSMEEHVRMVREVLGRLQQHHLYVKLEKCEFHRSTVTFLGYVISRHGVEMDVVKVQAVTEWPAPTSVRELQRFLGFANFYRRFIRNYSSVAGPLTSLLRGKPKKLTWTDPARSAFQQLKNSFTTAPILRHPDPDLPKLMSAEVNYDVGNRELLAIKAALEEWRHWLEGARHPFQVLTDHRNLEYLRGAKRLNPRQARQFEADDEPTQPDVILPATAILAPVQWNLIEDIRQAHTDEPPPTGCPLTKLFVPLHFRQQARTSRLLPEGLLEPLPVPRRPWSHLSVDFLTDLPDSGGFTTSAEAMFNHVFHNFGLPEDIVSDRGPQFTSRSNGQAERLNQEIGHFLRTYCSREQHRWRLTPFQCVLGYQPPLFPWLGEPSDVPAVEEWYRLSQEVWERAHVRLQRAVRRQRIQADRRRHPHPSYQVGQKVWLSTRNLHLKLPCQKLSPKFIGPFEIVRQVNPVAYRLRLPASYRICPTFHVSLLKPAHSSAGETGVCEEPPPPLDIERSPAYRSELDEVMESIPMGEKVLIGMDFNGHVGEGNRGDEEMMGKFGDKERNLEGQMVVDFAKRMDMAVVNTYFQKREEHRVTYKSG